MKIEYTYNSLSKAQKWANLSIESAKKLIRRAAVNGQSSEDLSTRERAYCEGMITHNNRRAIVYAGYGFIFTDENYCVNMFKLPKWFGKASLYFSGKKEIRNPKKYYKYNSKDSGFGDFINLEEIA